MNEKNDQTILHLSCKDGNKEIAEILLDHGASLYEVDSNHETPLHKEWVHLKRVYYLFVYSKKECKPSSYPRDYIEEIEF